MPSATEPPTAFARRPLRAGARDALGQPVVVILAADLQGQVVVIRQRHEVDAFERRVHELDQFITRRGDVVVTFLVAPHMLSVVLWVRHLLQALSRSRGTAPAALYL